MISHSPEQAAVAMQLVADLSQYEEGLRELLQRRWDPGLYRELSDCFDRMHMHATLLPKLGSSWAELLITRVELVQALWAADVKTCFNGRVVALHAKHRVLIDEVRCRCAEYVAKGARVSTPANEARP